MRLSIESSTTTPTPSLLVSPPCHLTGRCPPPPRLDTSRYSSALQSWEGTSTSAYFFPWTWLSSSILHFNCRCAASLFLAMPIGNWRSPPIIFIILERDERGKSSLGNRSAFCAIFPKCRSLGSCGGGDNLVPRDWQGGGGGSTFKGDS